MFHVYFAEWQDTCLEIEEDSGKFTEEDSWGDVIQCAIQRSLGRVRDEP